MVNQQVNEPRLFKVAIIYMVEERTEKRVADLREQLLASNIEAFTFKEDMPVVESHVAEMQKRIKNADSVIICYSKNFEKGDGYRHQEVLKVLNEKEKKPRGNAYLIPVNLDECKMPDYLNEPRILDYFQRDHFDGIMRLGLMVRREQLIKEGKNIQEFKYCSSQPQQEYEKRVVPPPDKARSIPPSSVQNPRGFKYIYKTFFSFGSKKRLFKISLIFVLIASLALILVLYAAIQAFHPYSLTTIGSTSTGHTYNLNIPCTSTSDTRNPTDCISDFPISLTLDSIDSKANPTSWHFTFKNPGGGSEQYCKTINFFDMQLTDRQGNSYSAGEVQRTWQLSKGQSQFVTFTFDVSQSGNPFQLKASIHDCHYDIYYQSSRIYLPN